MWVTRMSPSSSLLSVDHREPETAAQQATITQGSATPAVQDGDDSIAGATLPKPSIALGASS